MASHSRSTAYLWTLAAQWTSPSWESPHGAARRSLQRPPSPASSATREGSRIAAPGSSWRLRYQLRSPQDDLVWNLLSTSGVLSLIMGVLSLIMKPTIYYSCIMVYHVSVYILYYQAWGRLISPKYGFWCGWGGWEPWSWQWFLVVLKQLVPSCSLWDLGWDEHLKNQSPRTTDDTSWRQELQKQQQMRSQASRRVRNADIHQTSAIFEGGWGNGSDQLGDLHCCLRSRIAVRCCGSCPSGGFP